MAVRARAKYSRCRKSICSEIKVAVKQMIPASSTIGIERPSTPRWYWMPNSGYQGRFSCHRKPVRSGKAAIRL